MKISTWKTCFFTFLLFFLVFAFVCPSFAANPHGVMGNVTNSDSSVPADADIQFQAYVTTRPAEILTESSAGSSYSGGIYLVQLAPLSSWTPGEILEIVFTNTANLEGRTIQVTLTGAGIDSQDVQLQGPALTVTNVIPGNGTTLGGTAVTITGTNFVAGATVDFGGSAGVGVNVASATSITCTTPAHATGTVDVTVTNPDTQSATLTSGFTFVPPPAVTSVIPGSGPTFGGTPVTITGNGFITGATVTFDGLAAGSVNVASSTSITCNTPAHAAGAVTVTVTNPDTQADNGAFTYVEVDPAITSISPNIGPTSGNTSVTITGSNFSPNPQVFFGDFSYPATGVNRVSENTIICSIPAHDAGSVDVIVRNNDGRQGTLPGGFEYSDTIVTAAVPTLSEYGMILFSLLMFGAALLFMRRKSHAV